MTRAAVRTLDTFFADVDECEEGTHNCEHICENTSPGFSCLCRPGYQRVYDGSKCRRKSLGAERRSDISVHISSSAVCAFSSRKTSRMEAQALWLGFIFKSATSYRFVFYTFLEPHNFSLGFNESQAS